MRRLVLVLTLLFALGYSLTGFSQGTGKSSSTSTKSASQVTLRDQLEKGLYARRPSEFAFLDRVIKSVDQGKLPRSVVQSTFLYARKKPSKRLQYFQFALQLRAKKLGVKL